MCAMRVINVQHNIPSTHVCTVKPQIEQKSVIRVYTFKLCTQKSKQLDFISQTSSDRFYMWQSIIMSKFIDLSSMHTSKRSFKYSIQLRQYRSILRKLILNRYTVDTRYLHILGTLQNISKISKCRHKRRQWYVEEFSLCLKLNKCECLRFKSMKDVCSCPIIMLCVSVINS